MGYITKILILLIVFSLPKLGWTQVDRPKLNSFINQNQIQPEPLSIEEAFPYFVSELSPGKYEVMWSLAPGHYLYRHAFKFTLLQTKESEEQPVDFVLPDGLKKVDQFFGQIEAYYEKITVDLSLQTVPGPEAKIIIQYQGCADWGFCYPPQKGLFTLHP